MKNKNKQTRFPVARIKRIMQKDEEVGKVAQATPVVISKALEMFLGMIVEEAGKVTTERGSKKLEAYHLKHAIETVDVLDFLKEIVEAVPDPSAGGTIDLAAEAAEKAAAKKRAGRARKPAPEGEEGGGAGGAPAPVRRGRKKEGNEGDGTQGRGSGRGRGRGRAKVVQPDENQMDEDEDDEPEPEEEIVGRAPVGRTKEEEEDDWEG